MSSLPQALSPEQLIHTADEIRRQEIAKAELVQILPYKVTLPSTRYTWAPKATRYRVKADRTEVATGLTKRQAEKLAGVKHEKPAGNSFAPLLKEYVPVYSAKKLEEALARAEAVGGKLYQRVGRERRVLPGQMGDYWMVAKPSAQFPWAELLRSELNEIPEEFEEVAP